MVCDYGEDALVVPNADHSAWCMMSKALLTVISYVKSKYLPSSKSLSRQSSVAFCPTFRVCGFIPRRINGGEWGEQTGEPLLVYVTSFSEAIVSCILANILTLTKPFYGPVLPPLQSMYM